MRIGSSVSLLLVLFLFASCSRPDRDLASSAVAKDFDGQWDGTWNWDPNRTTSLEISGLQLKFAGLPIEKASGENTVLTSQGEAHFEREYGSEGAPCVLLYIQSNIMTVPLFITKDKKHLIYDVDLNYDKQIIFTKKTETTSR